MHDTLCVTWEPTILLYLHCTAELVHEIPNHTDFTHLEGYLSRLKRFEFRRSCDSLAYQAVFPIRQQPSQTKQPWIHDRQRRRRTGGVAAVGGVAEDVDVESMHARSQARDPAPHLGVP